MATIRDANFTGLRTSLGEWLHRSDLTNTDLGNFIWLAEAHFNTEMRDRGMEASTTIPVTSGYLAHPADWREWKSISLVSGNTRIPLQPLSQEQVDLVYGSAYGQIPAGYVINSDRTIIVPGATGSFSYETWYYQGVPALTASATTNWLLTKYPQAYLYQSLLEAVGFTSEDDRIPLWKAGVDEALNKIAIASQNARYSGAVLQSRPDRSC
jgi:hypothetical protein